MSLLLRTQSECVNCNDRRCMDCVLRHVHENCVFDCPTCCPRSEPVGGAADQAMAAERDRQLREGIACLVCETRFHGPTTNLDGMCPVCRARAERDRYRVALRLWMVHDHSAQMGSKRPINGCERCRWEAEGWL